MSQMWLIPSARTARGGQRGRIPAWQWGSALRHNYGPATQLANGEPGPREEYIFCSRARIQNAGPSPAQP